MVNRPDAGLVKQHLCGDKGYDVWALREHFWGLNYELHIANKGVVFTPEVSELDEARVPRRWVRPKPVRCCCRGQEGGAFVFVAERVSGVENSVVAS